MILDTVVIIYRHWASIAQTVARYGPRCYKTCFQGIRKKRVSNQSPQLHRLARKLKFHLCSTFLKANNKGADQTVWMRRLVCTIVVCKLLKTGFLASRPI